MSGIEALGSVPVVRLVAWALLHFLWQGALVGLALAGVLALLEKKSASLRYAVAAGALLVLLALPFATAARLAPDEAAGSGFLAPTARALPAPVAPVAAPVPTRGETAGEALFALFLPGLFAFWFGGVAVLSVYNLGGWTVARRLRHRATRPAPELWEAAVERLRHRLGISRAVALLESSALSVPAVVGWLRPVILVPASTFAGLSPQHLEAVLAHELAHVRRHDYLVNLLQTAVETLLFYHPAVWWVSRKVREERENCCDDLAVAVCGDRLAYARALTALEGLRAPASPRLAMAADGGSLLARIRRLVGAPSARSRGSWIAGVVALLLLPVGAAVSLAPADEDAPRKAGEVVTGEPGRASSHGTWMAERKKDDRISLLMRMKPRGWGHWESSSTYSASEFSGPTEGQGVRFELRRDAGTFRFEGDFRGERGAGFFFFVPDTGYLREMQRLGYEVPQDRLLELALHDISLSFIREMGELGYDKESLDKMVEFRIHDVIPEFVREMVGLGYREIAADRLVELQIHEVTPEFIRALGELGYRNLPPDRLVEFRIHGVTPELIREARKKYGDLSPNDLTSLRIHGELDRGGE